MNVQIHLDYYTHYRRTVCKIVGLIKEHLVIATYYKFFELLKYICMVNVLEFHTPKLMTKWHVQTVLTQISLLLKE